MKKYTATSLILYICLMIVLIIVGALSIGALEEEEISHNPKKIDYKLPGDTALSQEVLSESRDYWSKYGYSSIPEYNEALASMKEDIKGLADDTVSSYSSVITDEQKENVYIYEEKMMNAPYIGIFNDYYDLFNEIVDDCESRMPVIPVYSYKSYSNDSPSYYSGGGDGVLTKSKGVNDYNGRRETWYSQRVLPGGGLDIPGRHVASDGTIRDENDYIVVAASDLPYGSTVDTSLGAGKVYDTGCAAGTTDIYTDW